MSTESCVNEFWLLMTASANFLSCSQVAKKQNKRGNLPWGFCHSRILLGGNKRGLPSEKKKKDLQFNISHLVAKTRCIFIGSLAKSGNEIIFRWETDQTTSSVGEVRCLVCFLRLNLWLWWNVGLSSRSFRYICIPYFVKMCSKVTKQSNTYMMLIWNTSGYMGDHT